MLWYIWALHPAGQARRWARRAKHATTTFRDPAAKLVPSSSSHAAVLLALLLMHTALRAASVSPPLHAGFHEACRLVQARTPLSMDVESAHTGSGQTSYVVFRGPLRRDRIFENTHYGHNKRMTGWIVVCKEQNHCALSLRSLRFQHTQTMRAFTTVTALSTHANTVHFHYGHYGHCAFNTRAKRNKMRMQKTKRATTWQPKRAMWITATRRRPMTRFLHACGSKWSDAYVAVWASGCACVRACVGVVCKCAGMRHKSHDDSPNTISVLGRGAGEG